MSTIFGIPPWLQVSDVVIVIVAAILDILTIDSSPRIEESLRIAEQWIENFERWVESLPFREVSTWHIRKVYEWIETRIWKKHPSWIYFIVGYLVTMVLCVHSILAYVDPVELLKVQYVTPEMLPSSIWLYPIPANILGGIFFVIGRRLLLACQRRGIFVLYLYLLLLKILMAAILAFFIIGGLVFGLIGYFHYHSHLEPSKVANPYIARGFVTMIFYYGLGVANAIQVFDIFFIIVQMVLVIWITLYIAIFLSKAARLGLRRRNWYFSGLAGAIMGTVSTGIAVCSSLHVERWSLYERQLTSWLIGFGH